MCYLEMVGPKIMGRYLGVVAFVFTGPGLCFHEQGRSLRQWDVVKLSPMVGNL
jgi:hypothetical protein